MDPVVFAQKASQLQGSISNLSKGDKKILNYLPPNKPANIVQLAADLLMSPSEAIGSIGNLIAKGLIEETEPKPESNELLNNFSKDLEYFISPLGVLAGSMLEKSMLENMMQTQVDQDASK